MEIQGKLAQANGRLKASAVGVQIQAIGDRLYLRATFPPRPGSSRSTAYQQRLALGFHANSYGISQAEKEARKIGALLDCGEFDWQPYLKKKSHSLQYDSAAYWISKFEAEHKEKVCATTWKTEYQRVFNRLDGSAKLTPELLQNAVLEIEPNTRQRKRFCVSLGKLADFAGLDVNFNSLKGKYSIQQINPRDLPSDDLIIEHFYRFKNLSWRWVYGMLATFGLRNHEVFYLDTSDLVAGGYKVVVKEGKTGRRAVWSYHPEWVELFGLRSPQFPPVTGKDHAAYGERVSQYFGRDAGLPFDAYDLRHRWAIRTMECGLDITLSAQQMGHSVKVHTETYHRWITEDVHQRAFDQLRQK